MYPHLSVTYVPVSTEDLYVYSNPTFKLITPCDKRTKSDH